MGEACSVHGEMRKACRILVGKPEGKRQLRRPKRRWRILGVDRIRLARDRKQWHGIVRWRCACLLQPAAPNKMLQSLVSRVRPIFTLLLLSLKLRTLSLSLRDRNGVRQTLRDERCHDNKTVCVCVSCMMVNLEQVNCY
jgi:hypothetical protein